LSDSADTVQRVSAAPSGRIPEISLPGLLKVFTVSSSKVYVSSSPSISTAFSTTSSTDGSPISKPGRGKMMTGGRGASLAVLTKNEDAGVAVAEP